MSTPAVSVNGVTKRFRLHPEGALTLHERFSHPLRAFRKRELLALDRVSFEARQGEFVGLAGPNGCGKSTLLKVLAGICTPDEGVVRRRGTMAPFLELGVGFKPELTARQNVFLGGALLGLTHRLLAPKVEAVLQFADIEAFADQKLKNLSSGMVVRLAFAVAMLADADTLLMDEVLAVGDARFQQKCFEVFEEYRQQGRTVILVSHDLTSLETHCDRIILMDHGRIVADGSPADVLARYRRSVDDDGQGSEGAEGERQLVPAARWGNRAVEIVSVEIRSPDGQAVESVLTGQGMSIVFRLVARKPVESLAAGVAIRRSDGTPICTSLTSSADLKIEPPPVGMEARLELEIPAVALLSGRYFVSVGVYDQRYTHAFDHLSDVRTFHVIDERGRPGVVDLGGIWWWRDHDAR